MAKKLLIFLWMLQLSCYEAQGFEKLPFDYYISYGNPNAPIKVTEYFSFTCRKCLKQIREDFEILKTKYIDTDQVYWIFHPDPADKLTLQAMVCLAKLDERQKRLFFEVIFKNLDNKSMEVGCLMMQAAMEYFHLPLAELDKLTFLESTAAFQSAFAFLKQSDVIDTVPTVEINGKIREEFPDRKFLEKHFNLLLKKDDQPCK